MVFLCCKTDAKAIRSPRYSTKKVVDKSADEMAFDYVKQSSFTQNQNQINFSLEPQVLKQQHKTHGSQDNSFEYTSSLILVTDHIQPNTDIKSNVDLKSLTDIKPEADLKPDVNKKPDVDIPHGLVQDLVLDSSSKSNGSKTSTVERDAKLKPETLVSQRAGKATSLTEIDEKRVASHASDQSFFKGEKTNVLSLALSKTPSGSRALNLEPLTPTPREIASFIEKRGQIKQTPRMQSARSSMVQNYSADVSGLKTKNRDKMVDLVDQKFIKNIIRAANFIRDYSNKDPKSDTDVVDREKAILVFLFLQVIQLELIGKQNAISTTVNSLMKHAEGELALATTKVKDSAKALKYMAKAYYKPTLEQIREPNQKLSIKDVAEDIHLSAKHFMGTKPPELRARTEPFLETCLSEWKWNSCVEWATQNSKEFSINFDKLIDDFDTFRKSGSGYKETVNSICQKFI